MSVLFARAKKNPPIRKVKIDIVVSTRIVDTRRQPPKDDQVLIRDNEMRKRIESQKHLHASEAPSPGVYPIGDAIIRYMITTPIMFWRSRNTKLTSDNIHSKPD